MHSPDLPDLPAERGDIVRAPGLTVTRFVEPPVTRIVLVGELDYGTYLLFERALGRALAVGPPLVVVELAELEFLAVAGAHAFERAEQRCRRAGGQLRLTNPVRTVWRLLELFEMTWLVDRSLYTRGVPPG